MQRLAFTRKITARIRRDGDTSLMTRKRIYIAYTGGTIGMEKSAQGFVPSPGFLTATIKKMPEFNRVEMPEFHITEYSPLMDSSNMSPADWQRIAYDIQNNYADFDGFVVLHGTDTMAFTASALSFMFENLSKPVIITGSQIPFSELRSDGQENLLNALYIAANYPIPEVALFFNNKLFRGNRTTKVHADSFDAFASPNMTELLEAGINIKVKEGVINLHPNEHLDVTPMTPQPIGVVSLYPGISHEIIANILKQPVKALILQSYGVGNAPQNKQLLDLLQEADEKGIIIVNCTQCLQGSVNMNGYATGNALQEAGVISGFDMTLEATLTKLHYLLSKGLTDQDIKQQMQSPLRGELNQ